MTLPLLGTSQSPHGLPHRTTSTHTGCRRRLVQVHVVVHAPAESWLKAEARRTSLIHRRDTGCVPRADVLVEGRRGRVVRLKPSMSVTPDVSHIEMWPYVASAAVASKSHAATAILIFPLAMYHCWGCRISPMSSPRRRRTGCCRTRRPPGARRRPCTSRVPSKTGVIEHPAHLRAVNRPITSSPLAAQIVPPIRDEVSDAVDVRVMHALIRRSCCTN